MLYQPISTYAADLVSLPSGMAVLPMNPKWCSLAVMWVHRPSALGRLNNWFVDRLLLREGALRVMTEGEPHEMRLLGVFREQYGVAGLDMLPTVPSSAVMASTRKRLFDPAAWGQYVGGTPHGDGPGFLDTAHTLGDAIRIRRVTTRWVKPEKPSSGGPSRVPVTRWCPYSREGEDCVEHRLANLHVHSKNTAAFATCGAAGAAAKADRKRMMKEAHEFFEKAYDHTEDWLY